MRRVRILVVAALAAAMLALSAVPASAQGYTGWIEHPYPSAGLWYCDWYDGKYWCQGNGGIWFPSNPDWYNASYDEMMRVYGQGVLALLYFSLAERNLALGETLFKRT